MIMSKKTDILLNIILPLLSGFLIYLIAGFADIPKLIKNYLPDALWAYSFITTVLIIWNRKINAIWIIVTFFFAVTFELAQKYKVILGTGDIYDVFTYFSVFLITLFLNNFLTNKPQSINENT